MKHRAEPKLNIYFVSHGDGLVQDEGEMMIIQSVRNTEEG